MNRTPFVTVFLWLIICSSCLVLFSIGGHFAAGAFFSFEDKYESETMIAGIDVSKKTELEARELLEERVEQWHEQVRIEYVLLEERMTLPSDAVRFHTQQATIDAWSDQTVEVEVEIDEQVIMNEMMNIQRYDLAKRVDSHLLCQELAKDIRSFQTTRVTYNLNDYFRDDQRLADTKVAEVTVNEKTNSYLREWVEAINGYVIEPRQLFVLQDALKQQGSPVFTNSGLDILATGFYQLFMQTNFELLERHTALTLPSNTAVGFAATASPNSMDLKVVNPNHYSYEIAAVYQSGQLTLSLFGTDLIHRYTLEVENVEEIKPRTIVHYSSRRTLGDKQVIQEGNTGYTADVYRVERDEEGVVVNKEKIATDYYPPNHRIEEWSLHFASEDESIPSEDDLIFDDVPSVPTPSDQKEGEQNGQDESNLDDESNENKKQNDDQIDGGTKEPLKGEE